MRIDFKKLKPVPKMQDPARFPKIILPLEKEMNESYKTQLQKSLVDLTKMMVEMKIKQLDYGIFS